MSCDLFLSNDTQKCHVFVQVDYESYSSVKYVEYDQHMNIITILLNATVTAYALDLFCMPLCWLCWISHISLQECCYSHSSAHKKKTIEIQLWFWNLHSWHSAMLSTRTRQLVEAEPVCPSNLSTLSPAGLMALNPGLFNLTCPFFCQS